MGQNTKCVIITDGRVLTGRQNISATLDWVAIFAGPLRSQSGNKTLIAGSDLHGRLISTGNKTTTTYYRNFPAGPGVAHDNLRYSRYQYPGIQRGYIDLKK